MGIILTGDRPTGKLHIGHYVGSLRRRVEMQNSGEFKDIFVLIGKKKRLNIYFLLLSHRDQADLPKDGNKKKSQGKIHCISAFLIAFIYPGSTPVLSTY